MKDRLGWDGQRITALREALGNPVRIMSRGDLVTLLNDHLPADVTITESSVRRWEVEDVQPPYEAAAVMAALAGQSFEEFTLGPPEQPAEEGDVPDVQPLDTRALVTVAEGEVTKKRREEAKGRRKGA